MGVFIRASFPRRTGMREVEGTTGINCERCMFAHLLAVIIRQGLRELPRQRSECFRIGVPHRCRVFRVERDQKGRPRRAFHQGAERGALMRAQDEVPSQWPGMARSATSGGRSSIESLSTILPRGSWWFLLFRVLRHARACRHALPSVGFSDPRGKT